MISIPFLTPRRKVVPDETMQREIQQQRHRLDNSLQALESGSRVMENMAGMMQIMALQKKLADNE